MAEVIGLRGAAVKGVLKADEDVINQLEKLLAEAKDGIIHGFAIAVVYETGLNTGWSGHADMHQIIAGTAILASRVIRFAVDQDD